MDGMSMVIVVVSLKQKLTRKNKLPIRLWKPAIVMPVWKYKPPQKAPSTDARAKCARNRV